MLQQINVIAQYANQQITTTVNSQNLTINLYWRGFIDLQGDLADLQEFINTYAPPCFFADIYLGTELIIGGASVIDRTPINLYPSNLNGYLVMVNTLSDSNATIDTLGVSNLLYYMDDLSELDTLALT